MIRVSARKKGKKKYKSLPVFFYRIKISGFFKSLHSLCTLSLSRMVKNFKQTNKKPFRNEVIDTVSTELLVDWFVHLPRRGVVRWKQNRFDFRRSSTCQDLRRQFSFKHTKTNVQTNDLPQRRLTSQTNISRAFVCITTGNGVFILYHTNLIHFYSL